tara:strand:+ start:581 stop:793 length:213 start_codon:yes stop_codon:yes gene_type:complete
MISSIQRIKERSSYLSFICKVVHSTEEFLQLAAPVRELWDARTLMMTFAMNIVGLDGTRTKTSIALRIVE